MKKPSSLESAEQVSRLVLDPQAVLSDPRFTQLKQYITVPNEGVFGRPNPFIGFNPPPTVPRGR
jgi:hypothetical protein